MIFTKNKLAGKTLLLLLFFSTLTQVMTNYYEVLIFQMMICNAGVLLDLR